MSVLIKTMTNLPEHCYDCPCHDGESGYCQADKEHRYSDYRPFWCPLEAVNNAHWIDNHNGTISCSHCQTWFKKDDRYYYMLYCPYCNVKMAESEE